MDQIRNHMLSLLPVALKINNELKYFLNWLLELESTDLAFKKSATGIGLKNK